MGRNALSRRVRRGWRPGRGSGQSASSLFCYEDLKLDRVLQKASTRDNTVILTTLNAAWASPGSVIDLFIDSFRSGVSTSSLLNHLVIIAFDWNAYKQCLKIHHYCFVLATKGVDFSEEKRFLTSGYLEMMWKRLDFLRTVLEKGYSFIFST